MILTLSGRHNRNHHQRNDTSQKNVFNERCHCLRWHQFTQTHCPAPHHPPLHRIGKKKNTFKIQTPQKDQKTIRINTNSSQIHPQKIVSERIFWVKKTVTLHIHEPEENVQKSHPAQKDMRAKE